MEFLMNNKKKFKIAIDGPDGVGKSVLILNLAERLRERFARNATFQFEPRYISPFCDKSRWDRPGIMPKDRPSLRDYVNAIKDGEIGWDSEEKNQELLMHLFYLMNESALRVVETRKLPADVDKEVYLFDRSFVTFAVEQGIEISESIARYDRCVIVIDTAETIKRNLLKREDNDSFDDVDLDSIQRKIDAYRAFYDKSDKGKFILLDLSTISVNKSMVGARRLVKEIFPE